MLKLRIVLFLALFLLSATASAGLFSDDEARERIQQLEQQLAQLEKDNAKLDEVNKQQTGSLLDLLAQIETMNQELRGLRGQNEELVHSLQDAKNRQKDFYVDLDTRLRQLESAAQSVAGQKEAAKGTQDDADALENGAYEVVYAHYKAANYAKVIASAREFLQKYPDSARAASVYYLLGDAYFSLDDFKKSIASYQAIVSKYEASPNVPDAWLNIAACQQQLKDVASARKTLKMLISKYPDSKASKKAAQRLKSLK